VSPAGGGGGCTVPGIVNVCVLAALSVSYYLLKYHKNKNTVLVEYWY
jgi:hypothetical protein